MDLRDIEPGTLLPCENYCDQPYVVALSTGRWLCVMTTGKGLESRPGQHIVSITSDDGGVTWSNPVDVEAADDFMSSWATPLRAENDRVYAFYCYDHDGESSFTGGWMVFRYTDDGGKSWSDERYRVPLRITERDRTNDSGGTVQYFWSIDKPIVLDGAVYFAFTKLRNGFQISGGEGWVLRSPNLLTERDPGKIDWELLPEGDHGIRHMDFGDIQEEHNIESLSDGSLYLVYRTERGFIAKATSTDEGRHWSEPQVLRDRTGRPIRNPRACARLWKAPNGKFLLWHHNNGYPGWGHGQARSPVWISGGIEADGDIQWSQPELFIYLKNELLRGPSYPDFISDGDSYWVTETQKFEARIHSIDPELLDLLWRQHEISQRTQKGLVLYAPGPHGPGAEIEIPRLPDLGPGSISIELSLTLNSLEPDQDLFNTFGVRRKGIRICTDNRQSLRIEIADGQSTRWIEVVDSLDLGAQARSLPFMMWEADPGILEAGKTHHVTFVLDGAARIILIVVDGKLCDGGAERIQGWWRLHPNVHSIFSDSRCRLSTHLKGHVDSVRIYDRALTVTESIGNYRSEFPSV